MALTNRNKIYSGSPERTKFPLRKSRKAATKKTAFYLLGGPYHGGKLLLTTPSTVTFSCGSHQGRYRPGRAVYREGAAKQKFEAVPFQGFKGHDLIWESSK